MVGPWHSVELQPHPIQTGGREGLSRKGFGARSDSILWIRVFFFQLGMAHRHAVTLCMHNLETCHGPCAICCSTRGPFVHRSFSIDSTCSWVCLLAELDCAQ